MEVSLLVKYWIKYLKISLFCDTLCNGLQSFLA